MKKTKRMEQICFLAGCLMVAALLIWMICGAACAETIATGEKVIDLTGLCNAVIAVLGALVTYRLIPWIKARTTQSQQEGLSACTKTLVYAAEQLYRTGCVNDKLGYVQGELERRGYTADRSAIEAAVTQLRADTCAYLGELNVEEVVAYEQTASRSVGAAAPQGAAPIPAGTAAGAAGGGSVPDGQSAAGAKAGGKEDSEGDKESEEDG